MSIGLRVHKCITAEQSNMLTTIWLNPADFQNLNNQETAFSTLNPNTRFCLINDKYIFEYQQEQNISLGTIGICGYQRRYLDFNLDQLITIKKI